MNEQPVFLKPGRQSTETIVCAERAFSTALLRAYHGSVSQRGCEMAFKELQDAGAIEVIAVVDERLVVVVSRTSRCRAVPWGAAARVCQG